MKKVIILTVLAILVLSTFIVTCIGTDPKVIACEIACEEATETCYEKADGLEGDVLIVAAKLACDEAEEKCKKKCNE
jgi:hypothetical protein